MTSALPPDLTSLRSFLPELVAAAGRAVPYACALVTARAGLQVIKSKSVEKVNPTPPDPGVRISVWDGATWHSVCTNRLTDRSYLLKLARELASSVSVKPGPAPEPGPALDRHFAGTIQQDPAAVDTRTKQELAGRAFAAISGFDKRVVNAQAVYSDDHEYRLFADPGRLLSSDVCRTTVFCVAMAADGSRQVMDYEFRTGTGFESVASLEDSVFVKAASDAVENLAAEKILPAEYRCLLHPDIAGTLAHESFGHGCEVDTMMRGAARALGFIGKRVGSDLVNITDSPGTPGCNGSVFFSDDGVIAEEPVKLVRKGILQPTMMCDRYSYLAMKDRLPGLRQSASGRLESWNHPIYARMTNTYFEPLARNHGGVSYDEMLASTDSGIQLEKMQSGMEDPLGWGVQLQCTRGREIKDGRFTGRLFYMVGVTGYVPDVLASVDAVGTELRLDSVGMCGKGHKEYVRTATGGPWVRCRVRLG